MRAEVKRFGLATCIAAASVAFSGIVETTPAITTLESVATIAVADSVPVTDQPVPVEAA